MADGVIAQTKRRVSEFMLAALQALAKQRQRSPVKIGPGNRTHPRQLRVKRLGTYKVTHSRPYGNRQRVERINVPYFCVRGTLVPKSP